MLRFKKKYEWRNDKYSSDAITTFFSILTNRGYSSDFSGSGVRYFWQKSNRPNINSSRFFILSIY